MNSAPIAATIHDPMGPRWARLIAPFVAALLVVLGYSAVACVAAPLLVLANQRWLPRFRARRCKLYVEPGRVRVRDAGVLGQTLAGRKISAFSVTQSARGAAIALRRRGRAGVATLLEVASPADAERIRTALGIGSGGYGYLSFTLRPSQVSALEHVGGLLLLFFSICGLALTLALGTWPALLLAFVIVPFLYPRPNGPMILFDADHVRVPGKNSLRDIPYAEIANVSRLPREIAIGLRSGENVKVAVDLVRYSLHGMDAVEIDHVVAQLNAAALRAQGAAAPADDAIERLAVLRQNGEDPRQWLTRLDAAAQMMLAGGGYRGPTFEERELFRVVENPDADAELRGAAARVLLRVAPTSRSRVDAAIASLRDDSAEKRVRILLEPNAEKASAELDDYDLRAMVRSAGR